MNTHKINNLRFKGVKLADTIIKIGNGFILWEKWELYRAYKNNKYFYILSKGTKHSYKLKYAYTTQVFKNILEVANYVKQQNDFIKPMLTLMVRTAFDIVHAGVPRMEVKDRKYRMEQKLKQICLPIKEKYLSDNIGA